MNESTLSQVTSQLIKQRRYKKWQVLVSALACIVVFVTIYLLILPAITEETKLYCGYEEHIHTDECYSCYTENTQMNSESPSCEHTSCELICGCIEHEHTEFCYFECHAVLITMTYDLAEVSADKSVDEDNDAKDNDVENDGAVDNDTDTTVRWERRITVKDGDGLSKYLEGIATLPNGIDAKNAVWYNAENDEEISLTEPVLKDLELYANFDDPPRETDEGETDDPTGGIELYSNGYSNWESLKEAINNGVTDVMLINDITVPENEAFEISGKNVTINMNGCTLTLNKPMLVSGWNVVTITGEGTIQGNNLDELITVDSGGTLNLYDAVLTNPGGHGVHVQNWSYLNIYSASITNCGSTGINGGGVLAENGSSVNMSGGSISNNSAQYGGGIYVSGNSAINMTGGTISGNSATNGGGTYLSGGISTFSGGSVTENLALSSGGGIYAASWSKADVKGGVVISGNKAGSHGGGICADNTVNADPRIALSGQAVVRENVLIADHDDPGCMLQGSLKSCKDVSGGAENLLSISDDAYVEGIVSTEGLSGLILEADGKLVLEENQKSANRIVIESDLTIDLNGHTIEYKGSGNGSTLFDVAPGVTLTIIDSSEGKTGSIVANGAEALVTVEESAVLNIQGGTFNNAGGQHVILVNGVGTVHMYDGVLTGASTGEWGGGICALEGLVYIDGGKIVGNTVSIGGGGVCTRYLNMSGGEIIENSVTGENARGGGGINLRKESHDADTSEEGNNFNGIITGGTISDNTSDHVGGGIFISVGSELYIKGTTSHVYIENNKALDLKYSYGSESGEGHGFAGGGIFVEHPDDTKGAEAKSGGLLYVYDAVVTKNTALFGGGVAGCGSSSVEVCSNDGVAVYGNTIKGVDDIGYNPIIANSVDLYCDGMGKVDSMLLGNIQSGWSGLAGDLDPESNGELKETSFQSGAPTLNNFYLKGDELSPEKMKEIDDKASVFIRGNTSASGGGGIGGNGYIKLGLAAPTGSLVIKKNVVDADAGDWSFDFLLTINDEEQIVTLTKDKPFVIFNELPIGTTYSVKELDEQGYTLIASSGTEGVINGNMLTASFTNAVLFTLPATGGDGATIYILGGFILTSAALIYGYKLRYKRERRDGKNDSCLT